MILHWVDYVILATIFLSILTGLFRGFVKEIVALLTWGLGLYASFLYAEKFEVLFTQHINDKTLRLVAAFVLILIIILMIGAIVSKILSTIMHKTGLSGPDKILGTFFGFIRGVLSVALIIIAVNMADIPSINNVTNDSKLYSKFSPLVAEINKRLPSLIAKAQKAVLDEDLPIVSALDNKVLNIDLEKEISILNNPALNIAELNISTDLNKELNKELNANLNSDLNIELT